MSDPVANRKSLAFEFYELTGEALPEADPIITGAVFFSHKLAEAGRAAAVEIEDAAQRGVVHVQEASRAAAQEMREVSRKLALDANEVSIRVDASMRTVEVAIESMATERAQLLRAIEVQVVRTANGIIKNQSSQPGVRYIPAWYALVGAFVGAIALTAALVVGSGYGAEHETNATVGRAFARALPTMDPQLKKQLLEHIKKSQ